MSKIIINTDDLMIDRSTTEKILSAYNNNKIDSVSIITTTEFFKKNKKIINSLENIDIGVHLDLSHGKPYSSISLDSFRMKNLSNTTDSNLVNVIRNISVKSIYIEFSKQIEALNSIKNNITHIKQI